MWTPKLPRESNPGDPKWPWVLTEKDREFLKTQKIQPDDKPVTPRDTDDGA